MADETNHINRILYLSFNQDLTCINCGTDKGFLIFNTNPFSLRFKSMFGSGAGIVEIVGSCNIVALVGGGKIPIAPPNKCMLWDDNLKKVVSELEYCGVVRGVKIRRDALVVATDDKTRVYDLNTLKELYKIKTGPNPTGLCDLCPNLEKPLLLTKTHKKGHVKAVNFKNDPEQQDLGVVLCHDNEIRTIKMNKDGTKFVTSGELGTLVRIFDTETLTEISELRRGSDHAVIQSVYFSDDSKFLIVSSDKCSAHIFSLSDEYSNTKSSVNAIGGLLPAYFSSTWSMNKVNVPHDKYVAGMVKSKTPDQNGDCYDIYIATYNGIFLHYLFMPKENRLVMKSEIKFMELLNTQ